MKNIYERGPSMLRSFLITLSKASWARKLVTGWSFAWKAASRFVAGEKLEDALLAVKVLNEKGIAATLDHLGEHTNNQQEADRAAQDVIDVVASIDRAGVRSNVSIKLTQIGLAVDKQACIESLAKILKYAQERGIFVRLDMEDSPWVDTTLELYRIMRFERGFENTGMVIQAYLYRSEEDVHKLSEQGARVRLCKGAYKEPAEVAFPKKSDVDKNYDHLAQLLIDSSLAKGAPAATPDGKMPPIPGIASHDERRIEAARAYAQKVGLPKNSIEFQMLYGIRRDLQERLVREGYPVRVYVPYGTEWYPYFMRRLAERPANVWFFISNFFRG
jgi:proline dehydrogenase